MAVATNPNRVSDKPFSCMGCGDFGRQLIIAVAAREFFFFFLCRVG